VKIEVSDMLKLFFLLFFFFFAPQLFFRIEKKTKIGFEKMSQQPQQYATNGVGKPQRNIAVGSQPLHLAAAQQQAQHLLSGAQGSGVVTSSGQSAGAKIDAHRHAMMEAEKRRQKQEVLASLAIHESHTQIFTSEKLRKLVREIAPDEQLDDEVEAIMLNVAEEFITSVTSFACMLAKHRGSDALEVCDLQMHLEHNWHLNPPGFAPVQRPATARKPTMTEAHRQRLNAVRRHEASERRKQQLQQQQQQQQPQQ
jgi:histone H3/H4